MTKFRTRGEMPRRSPRREIDAPFLIVHGTQDQSVPIAQAQELYDKLKQAGVQVSFVKFDDGHMFDKPENRKQLALESLTFFSRYLVVNP